MQRHSGWAVATDADRLAAILAALPAEDAAFLAGQLAPPWQRRRDRLAERAAAVREALAAHAGLARKPAAIALATELVRITSTPHARGPRPDLMRRIIDLGGTLAWRRIYDIGAPAEVQQKPGTLHPAAGMPGP
jgi:hypothetical protein